MVRTKLLTVGVMLLVTLLAAAPTFAQAPSEGLESFEVPSRFHTEEPVFYQQNPPAGGDHAPVCSENAVHSLEHGVVWITYRPDLPPEQIETLRMLANNHSHVLVSPYPDLPTPVVGSAWGRQLRLEGANDPRLEQFVSTFEWGSQSPEPEGPCTGGIGEPVVA